MFQREQPHASFLPKGSQHPVVEDKTRCQLRLVAEHCAATLMCSKEARAVSAAVEKGEDAAPIWDARRFVINGSDRHVVDRP